MNSIKHIYTNVTMATAIILAWTAGNANGAYLVDASYLNNPGTSVITFEGPTTALPVVPGVNFVTNDWEVYHFPDHQYYNGSGTYPASPSGFFGNLFYGNSLSSQYGYTGLAIDFTTPQQAVGAYINQVYTNYQGRPIGSITTSVYNASGVLIGRTTTAFPTLPTSFQPPAIFVGFADLKGISRIAFVPTNPGAFGIDNLAFTSSIVPEPSSWIMLGFGFCAVTVLAKYRRPG